MTVSVTQEHIAAGLRTDCRACPIALAFKALGFDAMVWGEHVSFFRKSEFIGELPLPRAATRFQIDFDDGEKVEPLSFELPGLTSDLRSLSSDFASVPVV